MKMRVPRLRHAEYFIFHKKNVHGKFGVLFALGGRGPRNIAKHAHKTRACGCVGTSRQNLVVDDFLILITCLSDNLWIVVRRS